jgi:hypothetical protein
MLLPFKTIFGEPLTKPKKKGKPSGIKVFDIENDPSAQNIPELGGQLFQSFELYTFPEDEKQLILTYRELAKNSEIDLAINEILNEVFIFDINGKKAFELNFLENSEISESIKDKVFQEFDTVYNLMDFKNKGSHYFSIWYIDGRLSFHKIWNKERPKDGLQKIAINDNLKIKKIVIHPEADDNGLYDPSEIKEKYLFIKQEKDSSFTTLEINPDIIAYVDSGYYDHKENKPLSYLHKTIIPYNNLKLIEDSIVIYRVTRAPERRIFYVDVGNLPKGKAEQYLRELMNRFKNKLSFDSKSGTFVDRRSVLSMVEDLWLPRREGRGTQVETLPSGNALGDLNDVEHFKNKFWQSLNVPKTRFTEEAAPHFFGRSTTDVYRDEYRFKKFINRLRHRFMYLVYDILKTQLILKNIITEDEWESINNDIYFEYAEDNSMVEFKEAEILESRLDTLSKIDEYIGKYFTKEWVMRNVLKFSDREIEEMAKVAVNNKDTDDDYDDDDDAMY